MSQSLDLDELVNAIGDAIVVCDRQGAITFWNPGAARMFGFTAAEAIGQSLDIIIPERQRARHWEGYYKSMATGTTIYGNDVLRVPAIDKAGRNLSISFTVAMLFAPDRSVSGIAAVMRDETRKFEADKALRKRVQELEAQVRQISAPQPSSTAETPAQSGCPVHKG